MAASKRKMTCPNCGSDRVLRDAFAEWDVETQEWVLQNVFDYAVCGKCDTTNITIEEEEIDDQQHTC